MKTKESLQKERKLQILMDKKKLCERNPRKKKEEQKVHSYGKFPTKKIEYKYIVGKTKENKGTNLWGEPKTKKSTKGNIKMLNAIGWNIKQLDEKCPESLYVDERERESSCV